MSPTSDAVESYLESVPETGRAFFLGLRELVLRHAPHATETMSYNMPTFLVDGHRLLHASAWNEHLAIYPLPPAEDLDPEPSRPSRRTAREPARSSCPTARSSRPCSSTPSCERTSRGWPPAADPTSCGSPTSRGPLGVRNPQSVEAAAEHGEGHPHLRVVGLGRLARRCPGRTARTPPGSWRRRRWPTAAARGRAPPGGWPGRPRRRPRRRSAASGSGGSSGAGRSGTSPRATPSPTRCSRVPMTRVPGSIVTSAGAA